MWGKENKIIKPLYNNILRVIYGGHHVVHQRIAKEHGVVRVGLDEIGRIMLAATFRACHA